jgi:hypothetical protein
MERRRFLGLLSGILGGIALEQAIPFGRVWSFPKEIVVNDFIVLPPGSSARIVEARDFWAGRMVQRLDVISPVFAVVPIGFVKYRLIRGIDRLHSGMVPEVPLEAFRSLRDHIDGELKEDHISSVHTVIPSSPSES